MENIYTYLIYRDAVLNNNLFDIVYLPNFQEELDIVEMIADEGQVI